MATEVLTDNKVSGRVGIMREWGVNSSLAMNTTVASGDTLDIRGFAGASILIPTGVTSLAYYACDTATGTFLPLYDANGTQVTQTVVADRWYDMPAAIFACGFIRIVPNTNAVATVVGKG